jgi:hypothetical protein
MLPCRAAFVSVSVHVHEDVHEDEDVHEYEDEYEYEADRRHQLSQQAGCTPRDHAAGDVEHGDVRVRAFLPANEHRTFPMGPHGTTRLPRYGLSGRHGFF